MSNSAGGFYYRSDLRKPLPQDVRKTILSRFSAGGTLEATARTKQVPPSLEVTLRHPGNLTSAFAVSLLAAAPVDGSLTARLTTGDGLLAVWYRAFSKPLILAA